MYRETDLQVFPKFGLLIKCGDESQQKVKNLAMNIDTLKHWKKCNDVRLQFFCELILYHEKFWKSKLLKQRYRVN